MEESSSLSSSEPDDIEPIEVSSNDSDEDMIQQGSVDKRGGELADKEPKYRRPEPKSKVQAAKSPRDPEPRKRQKSRGSSQRARSERPNKRQQQGPTLEPREWASPARGRSAPPGGENTHEKEDRKSLHKKEKQTVLLRPGPYAERFQEYNFEHMCEMMERPARMASGGLTNRYADESGGISDMDWDDADDTDRDGIPGRIKDPDGNPDDPRVRIRFMSGYNDIFNLISEEVGKDLAQGERDPGYDYLYSNELHMTQRLWNQALCYLDESDRCTLEQKYLEIVRDPDIGSYDVEQRWHGIRDFIRRVAMTKCCPTNARVIGSKFAEVRRLVADQNDIRERCAANQCLYGEQTYWPLIMERCELRNDNEHVNKQSTTSHPPHQARKSVVKYYCDPWEQTEWDDQNEKQSLMRTECRRNVKVTRRDTIHWSTMLPNWCIGVYTDDPKETEESRSHLIELFHVNDYDELYVLNHCLRKVMNVVQEPEYDHIRRKMAYCGFGTGATVISCDRHMDVPSQGMFWEKVFALDMESQKFANQLRTDPDLLKMRKQDKYDEMATKAIKLVNDNPEQPVSALIGHLIMWRQNPIYMAVEKTSITVHVKFRMQGDEWYPADKGMPLGRVQQTLRRILTEKDLSQLLHKHQVGKAVFAGSSFEHFIKSRNLCFYISHHAIMDMKIAVGKDICEDCPTAKAILLDIIKTSIWTGCGLTMSGTVLWDAQLGKWTIAELKPLFAWELLYRFYVHKRYGGELYDTPGMDGDVSRYFERQPEHTWGDKEKRQRKANSAWKYKMVNGIPVKPSTHKQMAAEHMHYEKPKGMYDTDDMKLGNDKDTHKRWTYHGWVPPGVLQSGEVRSIDMNGTPKMRDITHPSNNDVIQDADSLWAAAYMGTEMSGIHEHPQCKWWTENHTVGVFGVEPAYVARSGREWFKRVMGVEAERVKRKIRESIIDQDLRAIVQEHMKFDREASDLVLTSKGLEPATSSNDPMKIYSKLDMMGCYYPGQWDANGQWTARPEDAWLLTQAAAYHWASVNRQIMTAQVAYRGISERQREQLGVKKPRSPVSLCELHYFLGNVLGVKVDEKFGLRYSGPTTNACHWGFGYFQYLGIHCPPPYALQKEAIKLAEDKRKKEAKSVDEKPGGPEEAAGPVAQQPGKSSDKEKPAAEPAGPAAEPAGPAVEPAGPEEPAEPAKRAEESELAKLAEQRATEKKEGHEPYPGWEPGQGGRDPSKVVPQVDPESMEPHFGWEPSKPTGEKAEKNKVYMKHLDAQFEGYKNVFALQQQDHDKEMVEVQKQMSDCNLQRAEVSIKLEATTTLLDKANENNEKLRELLKTAQKQNEELMSHISTEMTTLKQHIATKEQMHEQAIKEKDGMIAQIQGTLNDVKVSHENICKRLEETADAHTETQKELDEVKKALREAEAFKELSTEELMEKRNDMRKLIEADKLKHLQRSKKYRRVSMFAYRYLKGCWELITRDIFHMGIKLQQMRADYYELSIRIEKEKHLEKQHQDLEDSLAVMFRQFAKLQASAYPKSRFQIKFDEGADLTEISEEVQSRINAQQLMYDQQRCEDAITSISDRELKYPIHPITLWPEEDLPTNYRKFDWSDGADRPSFGKYAMGAHIKTTLRGEKRSVFESAACRNAIANVQEIDTTEWQKLYVTDDYLWKSPSAKKANMTVQVIAACNVEAVVTDERDEVTNDVISERGPEAVPVEDAYWRTAPKDKGKAEQVGAQAPPQESEVAQQVDVPMPSQEPDDTDTIINDRASLASFASCPSDGA